MTALLGRIAVEPRRPLDWWTDRGAVGLRDLVGDDVRAADRVDGDIVATQEPTDDSWSPATAAPAAIGDAAGITDRRPGEPAAGLVEHSGAVRWMCQAVVEHHQAAHQRNPGTARAADGGGSPYR